MLAGQLEVDAPVVREALCRLERDGFVRPEDGGAFAVAPLSEIEVREGYPVVILLEGLAVRTTPEFPPEAVARLREINAAMAQESTDAMAAATHDWEFHEELVRHCENDQLISTLRPLKRLLLRYEYSYMSAAEFVSRSVHQHEQIIRALERGDRDFSPPPPPLRRSWPASSRSTRPSCARRCAVSSATASSGPRTAAPSPSRR